MNCSAIETAEKFGVAVPNFNDAVSSRKKTAQSLCVPCGQRGSGDIF